MTGTHYTTTPVTLHLSTSKINPKFHNVLPVRHQAQLQYERSSAKYFIYRTEMYINNCGQNNAFLPRIGPNSSAGRNTENSAGGCQSNPAPLQTERTSGNAGYRKHHSRSSSGLQDIGRKGSGKTLKNSASEESHGKVSGKNVNDLESEKNQETRGVYSENIKSEDVKLSGVDTVGSVGSVVQKNLTPGDERNNIENEPTDDKSNSPSGNKIPPGTKTPKQRQRRRKGKSRKSDGRKSKIFNHRLKSPKKQKYIDPNQDNHHISSSENLRGLRYESNHQPLGLVGAKVTSLNTVQKNSNNPTSSQRLYHSAGRTAQTQNSPRLEPRAKTHLALSREKCSTLTAISTISAIQSSRLTSLNTPSSTVQTTRLTSLSPTSVIPVTMKTSLLAPSISTFERAVKQELTINTIKPELAFTNHRQELSINAHRSLAPSPRFSQELRRLTKVYLSEAQSGKLQELGVDLPCAPPATPAPEMYEKYEYVPSMADIRAQRAVKMRLEILEKHERKIQEKLLEAKLKREKREVKEKEKLTRRRQRKEIYTLNQMMTEFEHSNFGEFCAAKGIDPKI